MSLFLTAYLLLSCFDSLTEANPAHLPRLIFTDKGTIFKRLGTHREPVEIVLGQQPDVVTAIGKTHLNFYIFRNPKEARAELKVQWDGCGGDDCSYNVTVVKQRANSSLLFVCGTNSREVLCCDMDISQPAPSCVPSEKLGRIQETIGGYFHEESEPSILVESEHSADLYRTRSGSQDNNGIYKFGDRRVMPASQNKEQHYAGLLLSRQNGSQSQDRLYAFYRQKNSDPSLDSEMWQPLVTQVCLADVGGPKNNLQFTWTSQMNARLFCGDLESRERFSELVETATVDADHWADTKIYALFRNEWGMSAVCVYTIGDIHGVFMNSRFKGPSSENRPRTCFADSTKIPLDILRMIDKTSDMEDWILPMSRSRPLLVSDHNYTHISADRPQREENSENAVMFLSLHNGRIHKVLQNKDETFIISEYRPFNHSARILSMILHPPSKKLYVSTMHELVQVDVANCGQYGNTCEDCVLARDPHCGWKDGRCTSETHGALQDVAGGETSVCQAKSSLPIKGIKRSTKAPNGGRNIVRVKLPSQSKYFLSCPVSSRHAQYTWRSRNHTTACSFREEQCLLLIHSMGPQQAGAYECVSEEKGHSKVLAHYQLELRSRAGAQRSAPVVWVCLVIILIKSLLCSF